jgi:acyl-CoA thioesterase
MSPASADPQRRRSRWPEQLSALRDDLDAVLRRNPFVAHLGGDLVDWGLGWARVRLVSDPRLANVAGTLHGGAITGLADAAFEIACNSYGRVCVAVDTSCHYTAPARIGTPLVAEAEEVSRSRRTASYRITVQEEGDGQPSAWFMALAYRTARWHLGEDRYPRDWRESY